VASVWGLVCRIVWEAGYETRVAAPSEAAAMVMRFEPGGTPQEGPGYAIESDLTFDKVKPGSTTVLCIGGRAPECLRNDQRVLNILREIDAGGKWIFSICHGIQLLASAGLLKNKRVTCYEHVRTEAEAGGGRFTTAESVRDGNIVSSPTWREHPAFYRDIFACLKQGVAATAIGDFDCRADC
jgi:protease I